MPNYWLVSATLDREPYAQLWVPNGVWMVWYSENEGIDFYKMAKRIRPGDRFALKSQNIHEEVLIIQHLGIVKEILTVESYMAAFAVDWLQENLNRAIPIKGIQSSWRLYGIPEGHPRIQEIFHL